VSEKSITRQQLGLVGRAKTSRRNPADLAGACSGESYSLCPGQEKHTMHKLEVQIANSG
jgi:hypothetical protein